MAKFILTCELQLRAPTNANTVLQQIQRQLQGLSTTVQVNVNRQSINQINQINKQLRQTRSAAQDSSDAFEAFGKQAALAVRRFGAFVTATFAFRQLVTSIISGVKEAIDFERQIVKIAQVTNSAVRDMKDLSGEITRLSTSLGVSSNKLAEVAQTLAQAGLSAKDTKIALDALAKSELSPTFEDIGQTTEGAIAIFQQFGKEAKDLEGILGSLNAVSGKFAVESSDLIAAIRRTGGAFKAAGGDLNELSALFTSVRATTRESAESIATGFRTIFTRIQRPRTINFLRELGVELTDLKGQFVGPLEAVRRLSIALEKIPSTDIRFAQVIEELGGFRQVSKVIPLIQQFKITQQALAVAQTGTTSLSDDAAKAQSALAVQITKVKEEFLALVREFANDTTFRNIVDLALKLASAFIKVADAVRPLAPALATIGSIALGSAASKAVGSFGSGKGFLGNIFKFAKGGIVPGSGNTDNVPAMLQPGEFVLRKKAVEAIGPQNVAKFNSGGFVQKFAGGGTVFNQIKDYGQYNIAKFSKGSNKDLHELLSSNNQVDFEKGIAKLRDSNQKGAARFANYLENKAFVASGSTKTGEGVSIKSGARIIEIGGSSPEFGGLFLRPLDNRDRTVQQTFPFRNLAKDVQDKLAIKVGKQPKTLSTASVAANLDFGFIEKETSNIFDRSAQSKIIDAADNLIKEFNPFTAISRDTVAKITRKSNFEGALGSLFEAFTASVADVPPSSRTSQQNFDIPNAQGVRDRLSHLFGSFPETVRAADVKLSATNSNIKSIVKKAARYAAFDGGVRIRDIGTVKDNITSNVISPRTGEKITRKASGGAIGDTVPALLTPGEFVLDKDTVNRVGVPTLNRLNRKGFNKGGYVGKYAAGGVVGNAFSPTGFLGASVLLQTVNQFASLNDEVGKVISSISSAAIQASIFTTSLKQSSYVTDYSTKLEKARATTLKVEKSAGVSNAIERGRELTGIQNRRSQVRASINAVREARKAGDFAASAVPALEDKLRERLTRTRQAQLEFGDFNVSEIRGREKRAQEILGKARSRELFREKALRRQELKTAGFGAGAAVASIGGDILSRRGAESIQAGGTSKVQSGLGGALSGGAQGALIGATIGSIVPVIGTAVGAFAGGVIGASAGLISALTDAGKQIENVQFAKTVEEFNLQLKKGISTAGAGGTSEEIRRSFNTIANRISTTSGEDRVAAEGAAKASLPELQQFFDSVAKNSKTIEDFEKTVSKGTLVLFSSFAKIPFADVRKQYDAQIKSQQAAINAQNNLIKSVDELAIRIKNTVSLNRAIDDATVSLQGFAQSILSDGVSSLQDLSSIVGGAGNVTNTGRFETLVRATGASFGTAGQQSASDAIAANKVLTELPSVLLGLKDIQLLDEDAAGNFVDKLEERLSTAVGGGTDTKAFVNIIRDRAASIIGGEGKPQKLQQKLREDFDGAIKELSSGLQFASEIMVKQFNYIAQKSKLLGDSLTKQTALMINSIDNFNSALDSRLEKQDFLSSRVPNSIFSARATESTVATQLRNITSKITLSGNTGTVSGLGGILRQAQAGVIGGNKNLTANGLSSLLQANASLKDLASTSEKLTQNQGILQQNADLAAKALNFVAQSSQKLIAAKQKELSAVEEERKSRLSLIQEFAFGGPEARLNIAENQDLINRITTGAVSVQQLDPASLQKLGDFLNKLNPNTILGNGQNVGDFIFDLTRQLTVGQFPILGKPGKVLTDTGFNELTKGTSVEDRLVSEIANLFDAQSAVSEQLGISQDRLRQVIESDTINALNSLTTEITKLIAIEQGKFSKEESARQASAQKAATTTANAAANVSGLLGLERQITSKEDVEKAKLASVELAKLKKRLDEQNAFGEFRQAAGTLIRDDTLTEAEKQAGLLQEAQRLFPGLNTETFKHSQLFTGIKPVIGKGFVNLSENERLNETRDAILESGGIIGLTKDAERAKNAILTGLSASFGITADKAISASQNLEKINQELDILSKSDLTRFNVSAQRPVGKASGGFVSGPNIRRDIIPSMLMPGEFVMRKSAVDSIGVSTLNALNNGGISGFASGGFADIISKRKRDRERIAGLEREFRRRSDDRRPSGVRRIDKEAEKAAIFAKEFAPRNRRTPVFTELPEFTNTKSTSGAVPIKAANSNAFSGNTTFSTQQKTGFDNTQLQKTILDFNNSINSLNTTFSNLKAIQHEHTITGKVEVLINGDSALKALTPNIQAIVTAKISSAIKQWANKNFPGQTKEVDFSEE